MAYQELINSLRSIATKVNPKGAFVHGLERDGSFNYDAVSGRGQDGDEEIIPLIHLLPFVSRGTGVMKRATLTILFLEQDSPTSKDTDREAIINRMEVLSAKYLARMENSNRFDVVEDSDVDEPVYGWYQGGLSGVTLQVQVDHERPCVDIADYDGDDYSEDYQTRDTVE